MFRWYRFEREVFASFGAAPVPEAAPDAVKKKAKDAKAFELQKRY